MLTQNKLSRVGDKIESDGTVGYVTEVIAVVPHQYQIVHASIINDLLLIPLEGVTLSKEELQIAYLDIWMEYIASTHPSVMELH